MQGNAHPSYERADKTLVGRLLLPLDRLPYLDRVAYELRRHSDPLRRAEHVAAKQITPEVRERLEVTPVLAVLFHWAGRGTWPDGRNFGRK
jgi:hypothetical protein